MTLILRGAGIRQRFFQSPQPARMLMLRRICTFDGFIWRIRKHCEELL
jgi:hypothetical protein